MCVYWYLVVGDPSRIFLRVHRLPALIDRRDVFGFELVRVCVCTVAFAAP